jgi:hypothetical protein
MPIFTPRLVPRRCVALRVWLSLMALVGKITRPTFCRRYETPELTNFAEAGYRARQRHEARLSFLVAENRAADILLEAHNGGPLAAVPTLPTEDEPSTPNGLGKLAGRLHHETIGGLADMATWKKEAGARFRGDPGRRRRKLRGADSVDCRRPCRPWARLCCDVSALLLAYIIRLLSADGHRHTYNYLLQVEASHISPSSTSVPLHSQVEDPSV